MACTMLSSFTLQMPMNVASNATEIATQVFRRARAAVLSLSLGFLSSSSSTNCIGSGSMELLLNIQMSVRSPTVREGYPAEIALPDGRASDIVKRADINMRVSQLNLSALWLCHSLRSALIS